MSRSALKVDGSPSRVSPGGEARSGWYVFVAPSLVIRSLRSNAATKGPRAVVPWIESSGQRDRRGRRAVRSPSARDLVPQAPNPGLGGTVVGGHEAERNDHVIGANLRRAREARGMTQAEVAK